VPGRIRDDSIAEIRAATDVVALVGEYVALRPGGGTRMKGLCPFHHEKTPSFTVDAARGMWHCLAGETRVLTWDGVRAIRELAGGTHRVLARDGNWVHAPFYSFGTQPLMRIVLGRNGQSKELFATAGHRWFVRDGRAQPRVARELTTSELRPGHPLAWTFPRSRVQRTTPSPFGIAHGITFGDGSASGSGSVAQLDPVKDVSLLKWFPHSLATTREDRILVHHLPRFFKQLPPLHESVPYLYGWLAGYLAADGHVAKDGTIMLHCADRATLEHFRAVCTRLGIGTYGITEQVRAGFPGREPSSSFRIHFINEDVTEELFLLDEHRVRFSSASKAFARRGWVVRSVEPTDRVEEVYCAVVDQGHAFVLEDNILTGNCFGCQAGGDAIDFLMRQETLSFTEAVERLARRAGVEVGYEGRSAGERGSLGRKSRLVAANAAAVDFYHDLLLSSPDARPARAYLASRGLDRRVAERFRLGWAPAGSWDALVGHLRGRGFRPEELTEAGLARAGSRGLRDAFHARVLFPVFDVGGDPVAFGGRALDDGRGPKYLNTAETSIWRKGQVLYGLNWAKTAIVQAGFALVVEGYTDVIACHQAGVPQAVATCGTALRADHFKLLRRFTERVVLAFDADTAGGQAADRGIGEEIELATRAGEAPGGAGKLSMGELASDPGASISAYVLVMPAGSDPAEFVARHGGAAFRELVEAAQPLVGWWVDWNLARHDLRHPEGKARAARALLPVLRRVPDALQRSEYARSVVQRLHLDEREYLALVAGQPAARPEPKAPPRSRSPQARVECEALKFALQHPDWSREAAGRWGDDWFTTPATAASFAALEKAGGPGAPFEAVLDAAATEADRRFLRGLAVEAFAAEENQGYADEVFRRLEEFRLTRLIEQLKGSLQRMNPVERPDEYTRSFEELIALEARRRALREPRPLGEGGHPERVT
jgi:DNA primase